MKRGKRQVIDRGPQLDQAQSSSFQIQQKYSNPSQQFLSKSEQTHPSQQLLSNPAPSHQNNNFDHHSRTIQQPQITQGLSKSMSDDAQQKRKKIELLKQKYLKKAKPEDTKHHPEIQEIHQLTTNNDQKAPPKVIQASQIMSNRTSQHEAKNQTIESTKNQQLHKDNFDQESTGLLIEKSSIQYEKREIKEKNMDQEKSQNSDRLSGFKKTQLSRVQQVPKPSLKIQGRNTPPPPPMKKIISVTAVSNDEKSLQNRSAKMHYEEQNKKTVPIKQQLVQQDKLRITDKSQKSDNLSFAPPSLEGNQPSRNDRKDNQNIPPPPINQSIKQILNKKLSHPKTFKPPTRLPPAKIDNFQQLNSNPPTFTSNTSQNQLPLKHPSHQIDEQYNGVQLDQNIQQINNKISLEKVDASKFVAEWLGSPEITLKQLFPHLKETIEFYCLNKNLTLKITSNNVAFTPLIGEFVKSFVLNNTAKFSLDQKRVTEQLCLEFFYSSPTEFSDIFLVLLIKSGQEYLQKYEKALLDKFQSYLSKIICYKNLLLPEQINSFVSFSIERNLVRQSNLLQFLMLTDNTQIVNLVNNTEIEDLQYKLGLLSFCKLNLRNKNLIPLYLKLISSIEVQLGRNRLVQKVLNHLKELDIPQNLYQYTKQLKLKLLKNYQNNSQSQLNHCPQTENNLQTPPETSKDSGLFGYFNLNKAIDKIKTSTEKALAGIEKPKKTPEQQKKDLIVYDPIRKRYIINGQIPEDENQVQSGPTNEVKVKVPPPPPLGGTRKAPPPIHNKKPGPRIAGNRYV